MAASPAPALAWGMSWHTAVFVAALLGSLGWMAFLISPILLLILFSLLLFVAALASHWMKTLEVAVLKHMRLAAPADAAPNSPSIDDGARALVEGAAFQNIATSLVYAYCTPYGANVIKSRLNDQLRSADVVIEELHFGSHIPVTRVLSQPSVQRGELHLLVSIEWDISDGAFRLLLRRFNVQIEVRMSKVQLQGTVVVASTKAPWEVRFHASPPVFVDLRPSVAFGQLPSLRLDMLTPLASRCLLIAVAPFLQARYAHQWPEALGLEQLLAWSLEKLPKSLATEPIFAALKELATHPSFPFGTNAARFKGRQEYVASAAQAAFETLQIAKRFIEDKTVQTPQELLYVVKSADRSLLACLTASDEMQVLSFFPQPEEVAAQILPLYRLLGLSPILAEALSGIQRRATTRSPSMVDAAQEGSFVLLKPKPTEELPKVRRLEASVNLSQVVARTLLQSASHPALYLCAAPDGLVTFEPAPSSAATVWLVLFHDLSQRSFHLVAEDNEKFLSVRDGMLMCSSTERGTWYWLDKRNEAEIFASFSTSQEGDGLVISSKSTQSLEPTQAAGKQSWLRFVDCPPAPIVLQGP